MTQGDPPQSGASQDGDRSSLVIGVRDLRRVPGTVRQIERRVRASDLGSSVRNADVRVEADQDVELSLRLESSRDVVDAVGSVTTRWQGECRRCLGPVSGTCTVSIDERFSENPDQHGGDDVYPFSGDRIDLTPMLYEAIVLALPVVPLCRDECAGPDPDAHPIVAEDRFDKPQDPRWAALDELR